MRGFGTKNRRGMFFLLAALLLFVLALVLLDRQISPVVEQVAKNRVRLQVNQIVNQAVEAQTIAGIAYQDLVIVEKDSEGKIALLRQNTGAINQLVTAITLQITNDLANLAAEGIKIPLGLLSGVTLFAGAGPSLKVDIQPIGAVAVTLQDEFTSVGLNQSRHSLNLAATVNVSLLLPFRQELVAIQHTFPLTDSIIVGPLPETYLQFH